MPRGRFKGWKSEKAIAAMTPEEQKKYHEFVLEVKRCRELGKEDPDPKKFFPDYMSVTEKLQAQKEATKAKREAKQLEQENEDEPTSAQLSYQRKIKKVKEILDQQTAYQQTHILTNGDEDTEGNKNWWDENNSKTDVQETVIHHLSREGFCIIETNELFWIDRIKEMIDKTPDKVIIINNFSNEDMLRVKVPYSIMKKINTRKVSDTQIERMSKLGKSMVEKRRKAKEEMETQEVEDKEENQELEAQEVETNTTTNETTEINTTEKVEAEPIVYQGVLVEDETDEEFESRPMNKFKEIQEEMEPEYEPDDTEEKLESGGKVALPDGRDKDDAIDEDMVF